MKANSLPLLALASTLATASALSLHRRQDGAPRVMQFNTERRKVDDPVAHDRRRLRRRDDTLGLDLNNDVSEEHKPPFGVIAGD